jgi:hypothetical protein
LTPDGIEARGVSGQRRNGSTSCPVPTLELEPTPVELRMGRSPSMVPSQGGGDTYLVLDDLGRFGRVWRETAEEDANLETLIRDLFDDQYSRPTRIVAFNTAEGWSRDVTSAVADEIRQRYADYDDVPASVQELLEMARRR